LCSAAIESVSRHTIDSIRVRRVATADWARRWREGIEPLAVGERLWICPSWKAAPPPGRVVVVVDPGMAFGTGHHASTRGCLVSLEAAVRRSRVHRALDVGTGSGILAIALAKLGVTEVVAVDTDPLALAVASENFERNSVAAGVRPTSSLDEVEGPFDLVLANLFTNLLVNLAPRLTALLGSRGLLICSGFLADDGAAVEQAYAALGLARTAHYAEQGWVTLCLQKA
jgi:ribosomal protein L11 methyltransferase